MSIKYCYEYTDTFGGESNYSWVNRGTIIMPELTHYGYDGCFGYTKANKAFERVLMMKVKAAVGLTGVRGVKEIWGDWIAFKPHNMNTILFIYHADDA